MSYFRSFISQYFLNNWYVLDTAPDTKNLALGRTGNACSLHSERWGGAFKNPRTFLIWHVVINTQKKERGRAISDERKQTFKSGGHESLFVMVTFSERIFAAPCKYLGKLRELHRPGEGKGRPACLLEKYPG